MIVFYFILSLGLTMSLRTQYSQDEIISESLETQSSSDDSSETQSPSQDEIISEDSSESNELPSAINSAEEILKHLLSLQSCEKYYFGNTNSIFYRPCTNEKQHYDVISNKAFCIRRENQVKLYEVVGTITHNKNDNKFVYTKRGEGSDRPRVLKQVVINNDEEKSFLELEYKKNCRERAPHISMKPPTFFTLSDGTHIGCLVMKKLEGADLFNYIIDAKNGKYLLTSKERIDLCIALLKTLDEQVHQKGMVHKDIQPWNIKVAKINGKFVVNFFDFEYSKLIHESDTEGYCGTDSYVSPEAVKGRGTTFKSDIHAMALVIGFIFHAVIREESEDGKKLLQIINNYDFLKNKIFKNIDDISEEHKNAIITLLRGMYDINPHTRFTLSQSLAMLEKIKHDMQEEHSKLPEAFYNKI
jgi:serine/threonine protein kinase